MLDICSCLGLVRFTKMSTPLDVPPDSTILSRFLRSMPNLFSLDPIAQNAIEFIAIHPKPIKVISIQQTGVSSITITHETNANFKNFPLGSSVFLSMPNEFVVFNLIYDVNQYSNEGTFVFSHEYFYNEAYLAGGNLTGEYLANKVFVQNAYIYVAKINRAQFVSDTKKMLGMTEAQYLGFYSFFDACIDAITNKNYVYLSEETTKENSSLYISDLFLNLTSSYSYCDSEYIDLSAHSIQSLVEYFQKKYSDLIAEGKGGIKVLYDDAITSFSTPATCLIEGGLDIDSTGISWPIYTNTNFKLLLPIVLMIREYKKDTSNALKQTNQSLATTEWLEYWGKILNVPRQTIEIGLDEMYRSRMQRETLLPKSNNWALAELIEASTGQEARVTDGAQPFQIVYPSFDASSKDAKNRISSFIPYISTQEGNPFVGTKPTSIILTTTSPFLTGTITIVGSTFGVREYSPSSGTYITVPIPVGAIVSFRPASTGSANMNEGVKTGSITNIQSTSTSIVFTHSVGAFTVGSAVTITDSSNPLYNSTWVVSSSTSTTCTILTGLSIQTPAAGAALGAISGYVKNIITVTGKTDTTLTVSSTLPMTGGDLGYLSVTNIFPAAQGSYYPIYLTDIPASVTTLGPSTGSGTFIVKVYPDENQNLSQNLSTFVYTLVNRYKPAGLSFTIEPLIT